MTVDGQLRHMLRKLMDDLKPKPVIVARPPEYNGGTSGISMYYCNRGYL